MDINELLKEVPDLNERLAELLNDELEEQYESQRKMIANMISELKARNWSYADIVEFLHKICS